MLTQVVPGLMRGPRPSLEDLKGFKTVFNLEVGWFEFLHGLEKQERNWCRQLGIDYIQWPMSDFCAPTPAKLKAAVTATMVALGRGNVLVHCLHGEDRTGMVIAAYRILAQEWSVDQAVDEMMKMGFHKWAYFWWLPVLGRLK